MSENKPTLYNLTSDMLDLQNKLIESIDDDGVVDTLISQALEVKEKEFTEKAVAVATIYRKFDNEISLYESEINRLTAYMERLKKCQKKVKDNLSFACQRLGIEEIKGMYANISFTKSETTEIDDISLIPKEYLVEKVEVKPDKTAIKKAIQSGIEVQGAHIQPHKNINIK